jgi:uncharacterized protein YkwD
MILRPRRLAPLALAVLLLLPAAVPASAATPSGGLPAAEAAALKLLNAERTERGLVALRVDTRLMEIARQRSAYQAKTDTMSHTHSGGTSVFDLIEAFNVRWYGAGEIVAVNNYPTLESSAAAALDGWMGSPTHKSIILSASYNYIGLRAVYNSTGRVYWTGVFIKGPDRTGAWAKHTAQKTSRYDAARTRLTLSWAGGDTRLQVLTAGLRYYQVQRRRDDQSAWADYGTTTATSRTVVWYRGHSYDIRVRARDRAGNWGAWSVVTVTL